MRYQEKSKIIFFVFNTTSVFVSHFSDQDQKVKYKLQKKKDGINKFPKDYICLNFTLEDSFYQLFVYIYDIILEYSYSIYLFFSKLMPRREMFLWPTVRNVLSHCYVEFRLVSFFPFYYYDYNILFSLSSIVMMDVILQKSLMLSC